MSNGKHLFSVFNVLSNPIKVSVGDGRVLNATDVDSINLKMNLSNNEIKCCVLSNVFYIAELAYNLLSTPKASEGDKITKSDGSKCNILSSYS